MVEFASELKNWRLSVDQGRQTWSYLEEKKDQKENPQSFLEKYWLGILQDPTTLKKPKSTLDSARNGLKFLKQLQTADGHFAGEYGGPLFLMPGLVISMYITKTPYPAGYEVEMIRYLKSRANKADGGWGIHIEGVSTVFGTSLNYVALRLLGVPADDPVCMRARETLWHLGGAVGAPAWGKFWLSVLNVYDWEGNTPIPSELLLLPEFMPFYPGKLWCHTRMVYIPMAYLYGIRYQAPVDDLILSLRDELYVTPYDEINWPNQKDNVAEVDNFSPTSSLMNFLNGILNVYEKLPNGIIRQKALDEALRQIRYEDSNTDFLDIGPVNKAMNMLIVWIVDGPESETFAKHVSRIPDFMWMSNEGMMMNGTNGSQLWDTAFVVQAAIEADLVLEKDFQPMILKSYDFIDISQIQHDMDNIDSCFRHISKGAWPFSTRHQSYTVSDCTAEGLKTVLLLQNKYDFIQNPISDERLFDSVNILLSMQNTDGGFASYECQRGPEWLEQLNPAQVFGKIMVEYSYIECTTAVVLGLTTFSKYYPNHRKDEISKTVERSIQFIKRAQLPDGSFYGSWGICFTYAMFFAMESLASVGENYENSETVAKACNFIVEKQMIDGGWGETYKSCETGIWNNSVQSQVVQTAWVVLALMAAKYPKKSVIDAGIQLLQSRQRPNGEWLQENIEGVFNKNCMISYPNYKFVFPIWALSRYSKLYKL
ncbi:terpenoid cyclases/protein prenyltransferase alpha-alpha toroid [Globomyces pollinis-pini]|nr:terpenoid cyclases/protein prenyltransferase alpha-alpha toroid [Globomyces pollinis-pini]